MASFSTWVCRRSEEFRYGLLCGVSAPWYFTSVKMGEFSAKGRQFLPLVEILAGGDSVGHKRLLIDQRGIMAIWWAALMGSWFIDGVKGKWVLLPGGT